MKDYFSHDYNARNDKKLVRAFMKFGLEAMGAYWCIVEMLYEEGGYLPLLEYERISFELRTNEKLLNYLIYDSELFINDGVCFWSETAIERLKLRSEKSDKARKSIESRWNKRKTDTNVLPTYEERNTIKESKVKENKENESKVKTWRDDFNIYLSELNAVYADLITNKDFIKSKEEFYPNVDICLSLKKAVNEFWGLEKGWKHKKKSKTKEIDWKETLTTAIGMNRVYNPFKYQGQQTTQPTNATQRKVYYKLFKAYQTHFEKAYLENLKLYGPENVQLINYVD